MLTNTTSRGISRCQHRQSVPRGASPPVTAPRPSIRRQLRVTAPVAPAQRPASITCAGSAGVSLPFREDDAPIQVEHPLGAVTKPAAPPKRRSIPPAPKTKTRVVVLGSGWGAVSFVKNLDPAAFGRKSHITLMDPTLSHRPATLAPCCERPSVARLPAACTCLWCPSPPCIFFEPLHRLHVNLPVHRQPECQPVNAQAAPLPDAHPVHLGLGVPHTHMYAQQHPHRVPQSPYDPAWVCPLPATDLPSVCAAKGQYELVLVSPRNYMLFTPLLPSELIVAQAGAWAMPAICSRPACCTSFTATPAALLPCCRRFTAALNALLQCCCVCSSRPCGNGCVRCLLVHCTARHNMVLGSSYSLLQPAATAFNASLQRASKTDRSGRS